MSFILFLLLIISSIVRTVAPTVSPPELFGDEVDVGYQAYSLLKTGKDVRNYPVPLYVHSLSESRAPLLIYATVPSILIFKNTIVGVRAPEYIFGSLAPIISVCLAYKLTRSKKISLLTGFFLATLPWHIHYSRSAFEVVIMLDLIMAGTTLLLSQKRILGVVLLFLSMYTYSTAVIFALCLFFGLWILIPKIRHKTTFVAALIMCLPLIFNLIQGSASQRFSILSIFNENEQIKTITELRSVDLSVWAKIWHNKAQSLVYKFLSNYFQSFSTDFLFVRGDPTLRHGIGQIGNFLSITAPLILMGFVRFLKKRLMIPILWFILAPIPAALTVDGGYHATRLFLLVFPLVLAMGLGVIECIHFFNNKKISYSLLSLFAIIFCYQFGWYTHYYYVHYPTASWRWWHVGFSKTFTEVSKIQDQYTRVFINNTYEPALIRYLFYSEYDPKRFHQTFSNDQPQTNILKGYDGFTLDNKIFFGTFHDKGGDIQNKLSPRSLYILSQRDDVGGNWDWRKSPPAGIKVIDTITDPYNDPIFYLIKKE